MKNNHNILIVDDHPMIISAYIELIKSNWPNFNVITANDCSSVNYKVDQAFKTNAPFSIAIIDVDITEIDKEKLFSGIDIAKLIQKKIPTCLIIMLTMDTKGLIINNIVKRIKPLGFICKKDIDNSEFILALKKIISFEKYYSSSIIVSLGKIIKSNKNWDKYDTQILMYLEKGVPTKDLPKYINLSLSTIEKRKALLKKEILDSKGSDKELIEKCKMLKLL
ncbi:response regulator [Myroides odoratus]|uniref:response regulator n=1 Tax=Myroides odoratus TaxID=256 RepID=UPI0033409BD6